MYEIEAISGVFIQGEEVLLPERNSTRHYYPNMKDLMGGDILPEETPVVTLRRDARQKLNISELTVIATLELTSQDSDVSIHRYVFVCRGDYSSIEVDSHSYKQASWFKKGEIETEYLTPHARDVLRILGYIV